MKNAILRAALPFAYVIQTFDSVQELLDAQTTGRNADILLIDIVMPERDGISVARELNRVSPSTQIIFISAHAGYVMDVYAAEHVYFLTKPVREEKLVDALTRAAGKIADERDMRVALPVRGGVQHILKISEIRFFERQNHVTHIILADGSLTTALKLSDIEPLLPSGAFARPHNSYLVKLSLVRSTTRASVCLNDGREIPVSNQKRAAFMQALARSF